MSRGPAGRLPAEALVVEGTDVLIVRELTGDLYFGTPRGVRVEEGQRVGINTLVYTEGEIRRIAKTGFEAARARRRRLLSVDKANVLESTQLWRDVVTEVGRDYRTWSWPHVRGQLRKQLVRNPRQFDVIVRRTCSATS
jgi:3-isopropylmalate dehydrogenase